MRPLRLAVLALLLAGCASPALPPAPTAPSAAGWRLDCLHASDWSDPCTARATITNGPANENFLAVNPKDPLNVVAGAKDYNDAASDCVWAGVMVTKDGGRTWKNFFMGGTKDQRLPPNPLAGFQCVTDPMMAFDDDGTLYYVVEAYGRTPHRREGLPVPAVPNPLLDLARPDTGGNTLFVAVSRDGGETFGDMVRVWDGEGGSVVLDDKTMILANPKTGSIHFTWSQFTAPATQVLVSTSRDEGASWSVPVVAHDLQDTSVKFPAAISAARDGTLYLSWHDWNNDKLWWTSSKDDGATFAAPRAVFDTHALFEPPPNGHYRVVTLPYHVVDNSGGPRDGTIYLAWMENVTGHMDILSTSSRDGGATWAPLRLLTDDTTTHAQFHPILAVDDRGAVHVTYYDRRYDPGDKLLDLTWAIAPDGEGFTHVRITDSSFDGDVGFHQNGFPFIGDYNGLGVVGSTAYASWADTRMGRSDIAVARMVRN